jgi:hypothetical protein
LEACDRAANAHFFDHPQGGCQCGLYRHVEEAKSEMTARQKIHQSCIAGTCIGGRYVRTPHPICDAYLVRRCLRCERVMATVCQTPNICDAHGLHVEGK